MIYDNNMYCSKCKITDVPLVLISRYTLKDGTTKVQHYCNPCNTLRVNKYIKTDEGKLAVNKARTNNNLKNPKRLRAWTLANTAEHSGIIKKRPCAVCGELKVHKHHPDVSKPLEIVYLCPYHHKQEHKQMKGLIDELQS